MTKVDDGFGTHRSPEAQRYDAFCDIAFRMEKYAERMLDGGQNQTVIHRTEGMGMIGVVCATICATVLLAMVVVTILVAMEIHDMKAWQDQLRQKMAKLDATIQEIRK